MSDIDHRAEAVRLVEIGEERMEFGKSENATAYARLAQVHATLAANQEPTGHPVTPYREALTKLREAIRTANLHQRGGGPAEYITLQRAQWNKIVELAEGAK